MGPPNYLHLLVFPCGCQNYHNKRKHGEQACRCFIYSPDDQTSCASFDLNRLELAQLAPPSLIPSLPTPQRVERLVRQNKTNTTSPSTPTGLPSAAHPSVPLLKYLSLWSVVSQHAGIGHSAPEWETGGSWCRLWCFPTLPEGFKKGLWRLFKVYSRGSFTFYSAHCFSVPFFLGEMKRKKRSTCT